MLFNSFVGSLKFDSIKPDKTCEPNIVFRWQHCTFYDIEN